MVARQRILTVIAVAAGAIVASRIFTGAEITPFTTFVFDLFFISLGLALFRKIPAAAKTGHEVNRLLFGIILFLVSVVIKVYIYNSIIPGLETISQNLWIYFARLAPALAHSWSIISLVRLGGENWNKRRRRVVIVLVLMVFLALYRIPEFMAVLIGLLIAIWVIPTEWITSLKGKSRKWATVLVIALPVVFFIYTGNGILLSSLWLSQSTELTDAGSQPALITGTTLITIISYVILIYWIFLTLRIIMVLLQGGFGTTVTIRVKLVFTYFFSTIIPGLLLVALLSVSVFIGTGTMRARLVAQLIEKDLKKLEMLLSQDIISLRTENADIAIGIYEREIPEDDYGEERLEAENRFWFDPALTGANWEELGSLLSPSRELREEPVETWHLKRSLYKPNYAPRVLTSFLGWSEKSSTRHGILPMGEGKSALAAAVSKGSSGDVLVALKPITPDLLKEYKEIVGVDILIQPISGLKISDDARRLNLRADQYYEISDNKVGNIEIENESILDMFRMDIVQTITEIEEPTLWNSSLYHGVHELRNKIPDTDESWVNGVIVVRTSILTLISSLFTTHGLNLIVIYILTALALLLLLAVVFSSVLGLSITRTITTAVAILRRGTDRLRKGDLDTRIQVNNHDELGTLAVSFNRMTADLKRMLADTAKKERLEREIQIARQIQLNLLPGSLPDIEGFDIAARSDPALEVGGDYYDMIILDDNRLVFSLGDVSGKGIAAAMLMSNLQASHQTFVLETNEVITLDELGKRLNRLIYHNSTPDMFITCFIGILDTETGYLKYINAGHDTPVLIQDGKIIELGEGGIMFGALPDTEYCLGEANLKSGDVLAIYTDGLTEAMNADGKEFGKERLIGHISRSKDRPAEDILSGVYEDVIRFAGEERASQDDLTMIILKAESIPGSENS